MPIPGLVAYGDDPLSDSEDHRSSSSREQSHLQPLASSSSSSAFSASRSTSDGNNLHARSVLFSDHHNPRTTATSSKPAVIIRRHPPAKPHLRSRVLDDVNNDDSPGPSTSTSLHSVTPPAQEDQEAPSHELPDEVTRIRQLLRPPPIPAVQDWGIPPEPTEPCDEAIKAKLSTFLALKRDPQNPRHFNDSLMENRAFRNPHLYAKLVEFVDVDERTTNFPKPLWDPLNVKEEWYADRIAEAQKARSEATAAAQHSSKRARIDFASSSATSTSALPPAHSYRSGSEGGGKRHQPYRPGGAKSEGVLGGGAYGKGRERSRWG